MENEKIVDEKKKEEKSKNITIENGKITLKHKNSSTLTVHQHGATILSWSLVGSEMIFLSEKAQIGVKGKAVRGGIPLVFPQFGPGPLKQHGFARTAPFEISKQESDERTGDVLLALSLIDNEETRKVWDYKFTLVYTIVLRAQTISTKLSIANSEVSKSFSFTALLHTYLPVDHISKVRVRGLKGVTYVDKVNDSKEIEEKNEIVTISSEVDRIYKNVTNDVYLGDGGNADVVIQKTGFNDIVLWNPWIEKSKGMDDLKSDEYQRFVCVEAGAVSSPVTLKAGEKWEGTQTLSIAFNQKTSTD